MKYQIKVVSSRDADQVNMLRRAAYSSSASMAVKDAGIFWNKSDDQSIVLGIYENDRLLSTMRGEIISDMELIETKLESPWTYGEIRVPVMILSKAATIAGQAGNGFNSILRLMFFNIAKDWNVQYILGTMTADAARINSMMSLGYQFYENKNGWTSPNYRSLNNVLISKLDWSKYAGLALDKLNSKYSFTLTKSYEIEMPDLVYKEVKVVS